MTNYRSLRRDGLADIGNITRGTFTNLYAESISEIFNPEFKFNSLRFLGRLTDTVFDGLTLRDGAAVSEIYPLDTTQGERVTMRNVMIELNALNTDTHGPFGISGSNNTIENARLDIGEHQTAEGFRAVVFHDNATLQAGANNNYAIAVRGWRNIDEAPAERRIRLIFADESNPNDNYARVVDETNGEVVEQRTP